MTDRYIVVNRWEEFQHYKDRRPPWIKNYTRLISDDDYIDLTLPQRGVLHGLWMMYAASGEVVSENRARTTLARSAHELRTFSAQLESLNHAGFIHFSASRPLAPRARSQEVEKYLSTSRGFSGLDTTANGGPSEQPQDLSIEDVQTILRELP